MSGLDRERIELIFEQAYELSPRERQAMLDASCADDSALRAEVQLLLDAHDRAEGKFLEGDVARLARQALLPERVGDYRVLRELGRGGMGVVYLAERERQRPRRRVAVKVLRDGGHALEIRRRFEVERHVLAALDHPHIARLLDGGLDEEGHPFIVMEYVDGLPMDEFCDARRLTIDDRLRLFCTVARAVHHAHRHLIVHRDLKPSNILVTGDAIPKLLDFGIAKLLDPTTFEDGLPITADGTRPMTPEYASPEQIRGDPISTASDVYTLGILLCELLTGRRPYPNPPKSIVERELMVLSVEPSRPSSLIAGDDDARARAAARSISAPRLGRRLTGDLDRIVLMALRKEPERRYQSAEQLAEDIERHLRGRPVLAHIDSLWYRAGKFLGRNRLASIALLAAALSAAGGTGVSLWQARLARAERDGAHAARQRTEQALRQSEEVTGFLLALFEASDPEREGGADVTSRELVERGLHRVEELAGQPLVQAKMLGVIGHVFENLGDYERAQQLFERSLELRERMLGRAHVDVAQSLEDLGTLLHRRQRLDEARPLLLRALSMRQQLLDDDTRIARSTFDVAALEHTMARYDTAEALYRRALRLWTSASASGGQDAINARFRLGVLLRDRGEDRAADSVLREVLELQRARLGAGSADAARTMVQLASLSARRGDFPGAETWLREALVVRQRVFGDDHPEVAGNLSLLASTLAFQGKLDEAERLHRAALERLRRLLGPDHSDIAGALNSLALVVKARGDTARAEALMRESMRMYGRVRGTEHPLTLAVARNVAHIRMARGDLATAERMFRSILASRRAALGPTHEYVASSLNDIGAVLGAAGRFAEAEASYRETLDRFEARLGATHHTVRAAKRGLADVYTAWGRPDDAARFRPLATAP